MFNKVFLTVSRIISANKTFLPGILLVITVIAGVAIGFIKFDGSIEIMLPDKGEIHKTIDFLRSSKISDKVIVTLSLNSDERGKEDLIKNVEQLKASLGPPLFTNTVSGVSQDEVMDRLLSPDYFPAVATESDMLEIDKRINSDNVSSRMKEIYLQLLKPQGMFASSMLYSDPIGIKVMALDKLRSRRVFTDYKVKMEDGHFISTDEKHAMVIANTPVPVTDSARSRELIDTLNKKISQLPEYVTAEIMGGHLHTVSNEKVIKDDIKLTVTIASAAFLLLFLFIFRDLKAVLVFLIPALSVLLSMNLSSFILGGLSYWVAGLGTVIAGISVDYGIHVFVAVRNSGNSEGVIKEVAKPVSIGAMTTIGIFGAFFFSDIAGYHQLALFSIISIILSLLLALFLLPHFLTRGKWLFNTPEGVLSGKGHGGVTSVITVVCWGLLMAVSLYFSFNVTFDSDVVKLDGSERSVIKAEENFRERWGGQEDRAVFVATGDDYESALKLNDELYKEASGLIGEDNFTSLAIFRPSLEKQVENIKRWNTFWREGREAKLRKFLNEESGRYGFVDSAFSSFFKNLYINEEADLIGNDKALTVLKERFVQEIDGSFRVLSFFPDEKEYIEKLTGLAHDNSRVFIVSRNRLSTAISGSLSSEVKLFALIATITIVLLTLLLLRNLKKSLLALVPVITNILILLGFMALTGLSLNIANIIAAIVAMGLCIDYGIFMTYSYEDKIRKSAVLSVTLSAVTTLVGAGVLVFASHPALFSIGITLVIGVAAGYISSVLLIPSFEKILSASSDK